MKGESMAAKKKKEDTKGSVHFAIQFDEGEDIALIAVTNMTVQPSQHETIISFYQAKPPLLLGTPEQKAEMAKSILSVKAKCIGKFAISTSRLREFSDVLKSAVEIVSKMESSSES